MNKNLRQVKSFHETFGHPIEKKPVIPSEDRCKLRISLLQEELQELEEAILNKDIVAVADALCDIQYVLSGTILEFGMGNKFQDLFDEVQRSNMSKSCENEEIADATISHYLKEKNVKLNKKINKDGTYIVYRKEDNKILKSINYSPANLKKILNNE